MRSLSFWGACVLEEFKLLVFDSWVARQQLLFVYFDFCNS